MTDADTIAALRSELETTQRDLALCGACVDRLRAELRSFGARPEAGESAEDKRERFTGGAHNWKRRRS